MDKEKIKRFKKRAKIRCLLCGREFDDDYRNRHNQTYHPAHIKAFKHIPYESVGAVKNPFEAAAAGTSNSRLSADKVTEHADIAASQTEHTTDNVGLIQVSTFSSSVL